MNTVVPQKGAGAPPPCSIFISLTIRRLQALLAAPAFAPVRPAGFGGSDFTTPLEGLGQVQAGTLKSLGISTASRSPLFPGAPTINETLPGFSGCGLVWHSSRLPAPPPEIVAKLDDTATRAIATPSAQAALKKFDVEPKSSTPEAFAAAIRADVDK